MALNVSSRHKRRRIQKKLVNDSAFYEDDAEKYSSATESVIGASESNTGQSNILPWSINLRSKNCRLLGFSSAISAGQFWGIRLER